MKRGSSTILPDLAINQNSTTIPRLEVALILDRHKAQSNFKSMS